MPKKFPARFRLSGEGGRGRRSGGGGGGGGEEKKKQHMLKFSRGN